MCADMTLSSLVIIVLSWVLWCWHTLASQHLRHKKYCKQKTPSCYMYSRNLFVLDFARRFFVSCAQIFEAYAVRTLIKFGCDWRKIGRKGKCMKDSESTYTILTALLFSANMIVTVFANIIQY